MLGFIFLSDLQLFVNILRKKRTFKSKMAYGALVYDTERHGMTVVGFSSMGEILNPAYIDCFAQKRVNAVH